MNCFQILACTTTNSFDFQGEKSNNFLVKKGTCLRGNIFFGNKQQRKANSSKPTKLSLSHFVSEVQKENPNAGTLAAVSNSNNARHVISFPLLLSCHHTNR
jgi:hypothetical protein